jgi:hypothetical protein
VTVNSSPILTHRHPAMTKRYSRCHTHQIITSKLKVGIAVLVIFLISSFILVPNQVTAQVSGTCQTSGPGAYQQCLCECPSGFARDNSQDNCNFSNGVCGGTCSCIVQPTPSCGNEGNTCCLGGMGVRQCEPGLECDNGTCVVGPSPTHPVPGQGQCTYHWANGCYCQCDTGSTVVQDTCSGGSASCGGTCVCLNPTPTNNPSCSDITDATECGYTPGCRYANGFCAPIDYNLGPPLGPFTLCSYADCSNCPEGSGVPTALGCIPTNTQDFVVGFLRFALGIGGGIAFLLMLYGVLVIITSGGSPERVAGGQQTITAALGGLLFIIFSVVILNLVGFQILQIPGF